MTHTKTMSELDGDFEDAHDVEIPCRKCGAQSVFVRVWESSDGGFVDEKYTCRTCGHYWWVEGPDA